MTDQHPSKAEAPASASRRSFLRAATASLATAAIGAEANAQQVRPNRQDAVELPQLHDMTTEAPEKTPGPFEAQPQRVGYAIVGLGHLAINQILPAFGRSKYSKPVALVSGDRQKAAKLATQYGIKSTSLYNYQTYDQLALNPEVQVIYIVLPNSMHAEFVLRGAKAGKNILCEKPMATNVHDCERMIAACNDAKVKLMIAYRQQYEPMNRAIVNMVRQGRLGKLRSFVASNAQNQGNPSQWRQKLALSGGGCLPDVGIYCLNAARFLANEEPLEVWGVTYQPKDDPRFAQVEATCSFTLMFSSGLIASCNSGYAAHHSQFLRIEGDKGWAELSPAFGYSGLKLRTGKLDGGEEIIIEPSIEAVDQFAQEMDHMSLCIQRNLPVLTPGEEGLQDQRIIEAIYHAAKTTTSVKLAPPPKPTRGPDSLDS
jgi:predicted dehydrogenase